MVSKKWLRECIVGSAYTYMVQEGHNGIGIRKEGNIKKLL